MSPEMLAQSPADAELEARVLPDLMAEYADDKMDFIGFTGTPGELLKFCPVPHDQMTLEARNTFLINIMNASGASIKEEHVSYATELLEASDQEFNLRIRLAEPVHESESARRESRVVFGESALAKSALKPAVDAPIAEVVVNEHEVVPEVEAAKVASDTALMTAEQMNSWLQGVRAEYEQEDVQSPVSDEVAFDAGGRRTTKLTSRILQETASPAAEILEEFSPTAVGTGVETIYSVLPEDSNTQTVESATIVREETSVVAVDRLRVAEAFSSAQELKVPAPPVTEVGGGAPSTSIEESLPLADILPLPEIAIHEINDGPSTAASEVLAAEDLFERKVIEIRDLIDAIVPIENATNNESGNDNNGESLLDIEAAPDDEFIQQFAAAIQALPEKPHVSAEEQPKIIFDAVISTALKIQETQQAGESSPEVVEELKKELEALCKQLFESIGIEAEEDVVAQFIERVLAGDLSNIPHKKLTPKELAKLGTHEYKLEGWFHKFKQLLDSALHPHQVMGRVALSLANVAF